MAVIIVINLHDCILLMDDFYVVCSQAYCCGFLFLALLFALGHLTGHTWGGGGGGESYYNIMQEYFTETL